MRRDEERLWERSGEEGRRVVISQEGSGEVGRDVEWH